MADAKPLSAAFCRKRHPTVPAFGASRFVSIIPSVLRKHNIILILMKKSFKRQQTKYINEYSAKQKVPCVPERKRREFLFPIFKQLHHILRHGCRHNNPIAYPANKLLGR